MKKIGILTSGGDCGGLNAAVRSIFFRAKNTYQMEVMGIRDGTVGLMQRPVAYVPLDYQLLAVLFLDKEGHFWEQRVRVILLNFQCLMVNIKIDLKTLLMVTKS